MSLLPDKMAGAALRDRAVELLDKAAMTAAEGALLSIGAESLSVDAFAVDWQQAAGFALGGAALSLLLNVSRGGLRGVRDRRAARQGI